MKNALIVLLLLALAGVALLTKPGKRELVMYLMTRPDGGDSARVDSLVRDVEVQDHVLWTTVRKDGKTIYTGVFAHFFSHEDPKSNVPSAAELAKLFKQ